MEPTHLHVLVVLLLKAVASAHRALQRCEPPLLRDHLAPDCREAVLQLLLAHKVRSRARDQLRVPGRVSLLGAVGMCSF